MAYRNLIAQACANKNELFCRLRDFLCKRNGTYDYSTTGVGWTLFDSYYATDEDNCTINDYFVMYSPGEGGNDDLYIQITWTNADLQFNGWLSWNPTLHVGSTSYYCNTTQPSITVVEADTSINLYIYSDLDRFTVIHNENETIYALGTAGRVFPLYEDLSTDITTCSGYISAGSNVSITVDYVPSTWYVGTTLFIRTTHTDDMATVRIEKTEIKTLVGNTITVDLVHSYTPSNKLSEMLGYFVEGSIIFMSTTYFLIDNLGLINSNCTWGYSIAVPLSYIDPDGLSDSIGLVPISLSYSNGVYGQLKHLYMTPVHNTEFAHLDVLSLIDGTEYRCFKISNNRYIAIKEV